MAEPEHYFGKPYVKISKRWALRHPIKVFNYLTGRGAARPDPPEADEGDIAPCVYCPTGNVELEAVEGDIDWAEGTCDTCGRHVEYDYDPIAYPHRPLRGDA